MRGQYITTLSSNSQVVVIVSVTDNTLMQPYSDTGYYNRQRVAYSYEDRL